MNKKPAKSYTSEYKESVVELSLRGDRTPNQVAKDLDIPPRTVYGWLREQGWQGQPGRRSQGVPATDSEKELLELRARNAELERKVRRLEEDREILKKATSFFAKLQP